MADDRLGDWRIDAVATLSQDVSAAFPGGPSFKVGDRLYLTTLTKTSKGELIGFTAPNVPALALNIASNAAARAAQRRSRFSYREGPSPWGTSKTIAPGNDDALFAFFEDCMVSATFSFMALEAFCNYSISRTWRKPVDVKRKKVLESLHHEDAERALSTEEKLKSVLPKIYDLPTPAGKSIWERFVRLLRARDACVHIKYQDQYPMSKIDQESLFFQFLDEDPLEFPKTAVALIEYFFSKQEKPRWLSAMPPVRSNSQLNTDAAPEGGAAPVI